MSPEIAFHIVNISKCSSNFYVSFSDTNNNFDISMKLLINKQANYRKSNETKHHEKKTVFISEDKLKLKQILDRHIMPQ